jgi:hypothetical protein
MADRLFDTQALIPARPAASARTGRPVSARTLAQRDSERRRLGAMHARHGHGPEGQTCRNCAFLERHTYAKTYLKCRRYNVTSSEATDWRAKWPACGAFEVHVPQKRISASPRDAKGPDAE